MTEQDHELFLSLRRKIERLMDDYRLAEEEIESLRTKNLQLQKNVVLVEEEKEILNDKVEKMKLASAFQGTSYSRDEAKKRISNLVREIDNCIALLNK